MGVCGVGKTSIAHAVAERLDGAFVEGDDFHTPESKARMAAGHALTDAMRRPWLEAIAAAARDRGAERTPVVIACSALKRAYRDFLRERLPGLQVAHLAGDPELIRRRMVERADHFMPPAMLDSQLADLEAPGAEEALTVDIDDDPGSIVESISRFFRRQIDGDGKGADPIGSLKATQK